MGKSKRLLFAAGAADIRSRALGAIRPGVEALLLSAVALGCAQAGWSVLAPGTAGAINSEGSENSPSDGRGFAEVDVRSPFAPAAVGDGQSHAIAALLSGVSLNGVRMAADPAQSGAVMTLADGQQRAFAVGQDLAEGVRLAEVGADYVLVSYVGGQRQLSMAAPAGYSFARALMGVDQNVAAPQTPSPWTNASAPAPAAQTQPAAPVGVAASAVEAPASPFAIAAAPAETPTLVVAEAVTPTAAGATLGVAASDSQWLQSTLATMETDEAGVRGWRVAEPLPQAAIVAGLRAGDLIETVNGARPGDAVGLLAAAQATSLSLAVVRAGERVTLTIATSGRT